MDAVEERLAAASEELRLLQAAAHLPAGLPLIVRGTAPRESVTRFITALRRTDLRVEDLSPPERGEERPPYAVRIWR